MAGTPRPPTGSATQVTDAAPGAARVHEHGDASVALGVLAFPEHRDHVEGDEHHEQGDDD